MVPPMLKPGPRSDSWPGAGGWLLAAATGALGLGAGCSIALLYAGTGLGALALLLRREPIHRYPGMVWLMAFAGWWLLDHALHLWLLGTDTEWRLAASYRWPAYAVAVAIGADPTLRALAWRVLGGALAAGGALGLLQFAIGFDIENRPFRIDPEAPNLQHARASGFFGHHLTQGLVLAIGLVALLPERRDLPAWLRWPGRALIAGGLFVSQARSPLLGFGCGLIARYAVFGWRRALLGLGLAAACALLVLGLLATFNQRLVARTFSFDDPRWSIWAYTAGEIARAPVLGIGGHPPYQRGWVDWLAEHRPEVLIEWDPDHPEPALAAFPALADAGFQELLGYYHHPDLDPAKRPGLAREMTHRFGVLSGTAALFPDGAPHAHNSLLTLWAFHGAPAALLYLAFLAAVARASWRRRRHEGGIAIAVIATILGAGGFEYVAGDGESTLVTWLLLGLVVGQARAAEASLSAESRPHHPPPTSPPEPAP